VRVHLERLVELECLAIRHGRLGSQFVYEVLFDTDTTEAVAHIGLIDTAKLRHDYETNLAGLSAGVSGKNGRVSGGVEIAPLPVAPLAVNAWREPDGVTGLHIRNAPEKSHHNRKTSS
jgi:hypothetical protein